MGVQRHAVRRLRGVLSIPCDRDASPLGAPPRHFSDPGLKLFVVALSRSRIKFNSSAPHPSASSSQPGSNNYLAVGSRTARVHGSSDIRGGRSRLRFQDASGRRPLLSRDAQTKTSNARMIKRQGCAILCDVVRMRSSSCQPSYLSSLSRATWAHSSNTLK